MPMYDTRCTDEACGHVRLDKYEKSFKTESWDSCEVCGKPVERLLLPESSANVHGDEIDVVVRHGLCNPDGTPRRYRSKAEMKRVMEKRGLVNIVEHKPIPGTDKSRHTQRWF